MSASTQEENLAATKAAARKAAAKARATAHRAAAEKARRALSRGGLGFLGGVERGVVSGFHPYRTEIDPLALLDRLAKDGWTTCLPVVVGAGRPLVFGTWAPGQATEPGAWNIPTPRRSAERVAPDVMLVPLLAFDREGYRLGYGGGFYDRTIESLRAGDRPVTVGVAYAAQEIERVPRGTHDRPLDWILTETGPTKTAAA